MSVEKNTYELTYIVNAVISDDQIKDLIRRVTAYVSDSGGEIIEVEEWGSRRLAFPIQKKRNGYYVNMYFRASGTMIARMERVLEIDDNILRYLTLKMDAKMIRHYEKRKAADPDAIGLIAEDRTRGPKDRDGSHKRAGTVKPIVTEATKGDATPKTQEESTDVKSEGDDVASSAEKDEKQDESVVQEENDEKSAEVDESVEEKDDKPAESEETSETEAEQTEEKDAESAEAESSEDDSPAEVSEEKSDVSDEPAPEAAKGEDQAEEKKKTDA